MPIFASGRPILIPGAAIRMSQARASSKPPATAWPFSAATTGTNLSPRTSNRLRPGRFMGGRNGSPRRSASRISLRSKPAQNAGPLPVSTTARTSGSAPQTSSSSTRSACRAVDSALRRSGRSSVRTRTWPRVSVVRPESSRWGPLMPAILPSGSDPTQLAGLHEPLRDVPHLPVQLHGDLRQSGERLVGRELVALHQDALGLVDYRPGVQRGAQVLGPLDGALVQVHVGDGDDGVGGEARGQLPGPLVQRPGAAGVDVEPTGDEFLGWQRER